MRKWFHLSLAFVLFLSTSVTASAGPVSNDATASATAFVALLTHQKFKDAAAQFDDRVKAGLTAEKLGEVWQEVTGPKGAFERTGQTKVVDTQGLTVVNVEAVFKSGSLWVQVAYDAKGKIDGIHFLPATP